MKCLDSVVLIGILGRCRFSGYRTWVNFLFGVVERSS